jgi:hypothetical protein
VAAVVIAAARAGVTPERFILDAVLEGMRRDFGLPL